MHSRVMITIALLVELKSELWNAKNILIQNSFLFFCALLDNEIDQDDNGSDNDYNYPTFGNHIDTQRIEEIPAKEPKLNAVPLKSALKKKPGQNTSSSPATPIQDHSNANGTLPQGMGMGGNANSGGGGSSTNQRPLVVRQDATNSYNLK